jgi:hypothetical protein
MSKLDAFERRKAPRVKIFEQLDRLFRQRIFLDHITSKITYQ